MEVVWNADQVALVVREMFSHYVLELADDAVVVLNPDDRVLFTNRGIARYGWEQHQLVGRAWSELYVEGGDGAPFHLLATDAVSVVPTIVVDGNGVFRRADGREAEVRFLSYRSSAGGAHGPTMIVIRDRAH